MRLKVTDYSNTKSTVFSLAVWHTELRDVSQVTRYLEVINGPSAVVDKLHALLLLANEVEMRDAKRKEGQRGGEVHPVPDHAADNTKRPVSV